MSSSKFNPLVTIKGGNDSDALGRSVSNVGDVNGDGIDDVIIGAFNADPGGRDRAGEAYVIYGSNFPNIIDLSITNSTEVGYFDLSKGFRIIGNNDGGLLGVSVGGAVDVNNDNYDDVIIGSLSAVYVVYGGNAPNNVDLSVTDTASPDYFGPSRGFRISGDANFSGISVSGAGDVNNDDYKDLIIGAWRADPGGRNDAGEAYIIYGNATLSDIDVSITDATSPNYFGSNRGFRVQGANNNDRLGISVSGAGNVNGDEYDDVIVGANQANPNGRAYIIYGNNTLADVNFAETDPTSPTYFRADRGFSLQGEYNNGRLGFAVSGAGDVNADGYADIIAGAHFGNPGGRSNAGEAYLVYGNATLSNINFAVTDTTSPTYFSSARGFSIEGENDGDQLGFSVSGAGDVNNDGYDDVIIGAFEADPGGRDRAGEAYIIYGNNMLESIDLSMGLLLDQGFKILGDNVDDRLGEAVSGAGDVNNDGYNDLIIGVRNADPDGRSNAGEAYIINGIISSDNITNSVTITQDLANQDVISEDITIDSSLTSLTMTNSNIISYSSDINLAELSNITISDSNIGVYGYSDILDISATARVFDLGQAVTAQAINLSNSIIYCNDSKFIVNDGDFFSPHNLMIQNNSCTLPARDVDLTIDLSVTDIDAYNYLSLGRGFRVLGGNDNDALGHSVSNAGDVNNDGYDDIIIGVSSADPGERNNAGEVYVVYGNSIPSDIDLSETDMLAMGFRVLGGNNFDAFGFSVSSAGDINNDGYDDVIIGANFADPGGRIDAGEAYIIYGNSIISDIDLSETDTTSPTYFSSARGFKISGGNSDDRLGVSVSKAGDINNDGYDDIVVGAHLSDPGGRINAGEAYVIYGNGTLSDIDLSITDTTSSTYFGSARGFRIEGGDSADLLGFSVSNTGDVNSDNYDDMIVGAFNTSPGGRTFAGEAYVIYGNMALSDIDLSETDTTSPSYFSSARGFRISGDNVRDQLGVSARGVGDVNGDSYDDMIIGARNADPGGRTDAGEAYVVYGNATLSNIDLAETDTTSPTYFSSARGFSIEGKNDGDQLGFSVSGAGDLNNDGYDDIIVGAFDADPGGRSNAGEAYIIYGNNTLESVDLSRGLSADQGFKVLGDNDDDQLGNSVSLAGDINNDGFDDIILGVRNADPGGRNNAGEAYIIYGYENNEDLQLGSLTIVNENVEETAFVTGDILCNDIADMTISSNLTSRGGGIDLNCISNSLSLNAAALTSTDDIDLSNIPAIIFVNNNSFTAVTTNFPSGFRISGPVPTFNTATTYAIETGAYQITRDIEYPAESIGDITSANLETLTISANLRSYEEDIDLSNAIDLTFGEGVVVQVDLSNTITLPPMANVFGNPTFIGNVEYTTRGGGGSSGGNNNGGAGDDSGSSAGAIVGGVIGGIIGAALLGFGFHKWHATNNAKANEGSTIDTEMHEGDQLPGNQNVVYDEV